MRTEMDILVISNFILKKHEQPEFQETEDWQTFFELD
jgi:carbamoyltransferase